MKSRRRNDSEDGVTLITTRHSMRLKKDGENSLPISIDLVVEIFSRLSAKSIARCRCVSKLWASILRRPDFTELFLTRSRARPQLLFACHDNENELFFFSTSQPRNPDENSSPPPPATYLMKTPHSRSHGEINCTNGLVFFRDHRVIKGEDHTVYVVCNPSTGQAFTLPKMKTRKRKGLRGFFGYDPIEKQFKVLSMTCPFRRRRQQMAEEHQVLTLGTGVPVWRKIECGVGHYTEHDGISVNGVLYYPATTDRLLDYSMLVCFDLRSEMFRFIKVMGPLSSALSDGKLIDYNGKLGALNADDYGDVVESTRTYKLWVLEDVEREEWSERTYVLPDLSRNVLGGKYVLYLGVTTTNEIVVSGNCQDTPFYVFYYNIEGKKLVRVEIQGMEAFRNKRFYAFLGHVENVKLLQMF